MFKPLCRLGVALGAVAVLASCTVVVEEGTPPPSRPVACTQQYDPVCGWRGEARRTFANACFARAAGYRIAHAGECRIGTPRPPQFCTREYDPVCARRGNRIRTFGNACEARAADYRIIYPGRC